jgi:5'-nucleotidase/UDP-sugar diphosphatase
MLHLQTTFRRRVLSAAITAVLTSAGAAHAVGITILHVGDQESWLVSAAGNTRDVGGATDLSRYGGVDRLAAVIERERAAATDRSVLTLNAGDAFLPGARLGASFAAFGGSAITGTPPIDFYDAIAMRRIGFTASVFGNHEFDIGPDVAARFAERSETTYLSSNLDFSGTSAFASLAAAGVVAPTKLVTVDGGLKVGLVGATTPLLPGISSPGAISLIGFDPGASEATNLQALVPIIQLQIDALRAQGAEAIVLMSHLQNANNEISTVVPQLVGVDIVLSGGGHELMAGGTVIPGNIPSALAYPTAVATAEAGKQALVVTSNFGNRYVGELNFNLDATTGEVVRDAAGIPVLDTGSTLHRVSGAAGDADRVTPVASITNDVVTPVQNYVNTLNATVIGTSEVQLGPASGSVNGSAGTPGSFVAGVRNTESNLGNLVADSVRWATGTAVAFQNGGGIRASINQGDVTLGEVNTTLSFANLVVAVPDVNAAQLKQLLEWGVGAASPSGAANGRYPQISGMTVVYDTGRTAANLFYNPDGSFNTGAAGFAFGDRIREIVLDDGTVLVAGGEVVDMTTLFSLGTIDFTARENPATPGRGGDQYPFAAVGLDRFENPVQARLYAEALADFVQAPESEGGLGGVISAQRYGIDDYTQYQGRSYDLAIAVPEPTTWALMFGGLAFVGLQARRRARQLMGR